MPTVLTLKGLRFYFYSNDHKPIHIHIHIHIHISKDGAEAKIELEPKVKLIYNRGFKTSAMNKILAFTKQHQESFIEQWEDFFS